MSSSVLTVSQVNSYIKILLDGDKNLNSVFISGEISNFNNHFKSGHMYFSLKDSKAVIKAVMFSSNASRLRFCPTDGMRVIVFGRISLYEASGQYQIYVESMQPDGMGALALAYEQLKSKLEREGLFDDAHKLEVPEFPEKIGVITSAGGAVIQDIKNVVSRRYPLAEIILCPVQVQGEGASKQLTSAVALFNRLNNADVIIIGRGGGSFEDLNCFNDEKLVRAIYASQIPIISAVGHETDFTLCDFAADLRAPTPSAAAELAVPDSERLISDIENTFSEMSELVRSRLYGEFQDIDRLSSSVGTSGFLKRVADESTAVSALGKRINTFAKNRLSIEKMRISALADKLEDLSPINVLKRGYSLTTKGGCAVEGVDTVHKGDKVEIRMSDGALKCTVDEAIKYNSEKINHEGI